MRRLNSRVAAAAGLVVLAVAVWALLRGGSAGSGERWSDESFEYFFLDPYEPLFVEKTDNAGGVYYTGRKHPELGNRRFSKEKEKGVFRVFILGGSVANAFDSGREKPGFKDVLQDLLPDRRVEVVNTGLKSYNSPRVDRVHEEVSGYSPDLIVVMSVLNEVQPGLPPAWTARVTKRLGGGTLLGRAWRKVLVMAYRSDRHGSRKTIESRFRKHLLRMVRRSKERGVPMVLCTLPLNLRDMPPGPVLPLDIPDFLEGRILMEQKRFQMAARAFERHLAEDQGEAMGHYYLARCLEHLGRYGEAKRHYLQAHETSSPVPQLNESVLRRVARAEGVALADLERAFESASPHGLTGRNLIEDSVHWFRYADPLVSVTIARRLPDALTGTPLRMERLESHEAAVLGRLGSAKPSMREAWNVFRFWMWYPLWNKRPVFSERVMSVLGTIHEGDPELLMKSHALRQWLKGEFSKNAWERDAAGKLDGWWPLLLAHVGEFYRRRGEFCLSIQYYRKALRRMPELHGLRLWKAVAHLQEGDRKLANEERGSARLSAAEDEVWKAYLRGWEAPSGERKACVLDDSGLTRKMEEGRTALTRTAETTY